MIGTVLFTVLPTVLSYIVLSRTGLIRNWLLRFSFAWFLGQYVSTVAVFVLAVLLGLVTQQVLLKGSIIWIDVLVVAALLRLHPTMIWRRMRQLTPTRIREEITPAVLAAAAALTGNLAVAVLVVRPHLAYMDRQIYRSEAYWDLSIHYPMIQTFVFGDNFPPENESFSGVPMTYHFFFDLLTAIYAALGLDFVSAMNFASVMSLFVMLLTVIGFTIETFDSRWAGALAGFLCVTTGSLRFSRDIQQWASDGGAQGVFGELFGNQSQPYGFSVLRDRGLAYNGNMWNIFYFIAERQMIMAVIYLIFAAWVLLIINRVPRRIAVALGVLLALFVQWHLYVTIMVACAIGWVVVWRHRPRGPEAALLGGFIVVFAAQVVYLKLLAAGPWFLPEIHQYPRINFEFATLLPEFPGSPLHTVAFYLYGYGLRLAFLIGALVVLWQRRRPSFLVFTGIIIPTFVLINTVQLSPLSIYDNHKWLKPMNVMVDMGAAAGVVMLLSRAGRFARVGAAVPLVILLTLSGIMELMPYLNVTPRVPYASYPTPAVLAIREHSEPRASFLGKEAKLLHLAGRKMFLGNPSDEIGATSVVETEKFDVGVREGEAIRLYRSGSASEFCSLTAEQRIDYVEFTLPQTMLPLFEAVYSFPRFEVENAKGERVLFINARAGCLQGLGR